VGQNQLGGEKVCIVQTALKIVARCILMTTDPADLVLDPTCGSADVCATIYKRLRYRPGHADSRPRGPADTDGAWGRVIRGFERWTAWEDCPT